MNQVLRPLHAGPQIYLICLPYAGAGASMFREWKQKSPAVLRIVAPQLAGREQRRREPLPTSVEDCITDLLPKVREAIPEGAPVAAFGHSFGAVLAYELCSRLTDLGTCVRRLFVSGSPGPRSPRREKAAGLSDAEFLTRVNEFAGYRHAAFDDPSLRSLLLPVLRADVAMHERFVEHVPRQIDVPITAIRGSQDELVSSSDLETWRVSTASTCEIAQVAGGHMYLTTALDELLALMAQRLEAPSDDRIQGAA